MSAGEILVNLDPNLDAPRHPLMEASRNRIQPDAIGWYVAYTNVKHEKQVVKQLVDRSITSLLPTYHSVRRWKDRRKELELPLFPGYVFVHLPSCDRVRVLQIPGVIRFVTFGGHPVPVSDDVIESLKSAASAGIGAEPHPYLTIGRRVRVKHGPLAGIEGILVRKKDRFRVVISIDLIMRSVATEVQVADLE